MVCAAHNIINHIFRFLFQEQRSRRDIVSFKQKKGYGQIVYVEGLCFKGVAMYDICGKTKNFLECTTVNNFFSHLSDIVTFSSLEEYSPKSQSVSQFVQANQVAIYTSWGLSDSYTSNVYTSIC